MKRILKFQREVIFPEFQPIERLNSIDTLEWIDRINHPEKRKQELREAHKRLCEQGVAPRPGYNDPDPRECSSFVKDEGYDEEKACRWINSSSDEIKVLFGPIADAAMHVLVDHEDFIKTVPVAERASVIRHRLGSYDVICQSTDASSMEDHYANVNPNTPNPQSPMYRISNELMLYLIGHHQVPTLLKKQVGNHYFEVTRRLDPEFVNSIWNRIESSETLSVFFKAILDGYRVLKMRNFGRLYVNAILCSGEMNTSFKNGATMRTMVKYASFDLKRGSHGEKIAAARATCSQHEGDDSIAVHPKGCAPDTQWWLKNGWCIKTEFVGPPPEASFCGLIFDPVDLVSVPDIKSALTKFGWSNRRYVGSSPKILMQLLRSKALSMACEYGNVPILGALAHRILYLTRNINIRKSIVDHMEAYKRDSFQKYLKIKVWMRPPSVGVATRNLVARLQDIPVNLQFELEKRLSCIEMGSFSIPELDFSPAAYLACGRIHSERQFERVTNHNGRRMVGEYLKTLLHRDVFDPTNRLSARRTKMMCDNINKIIDNY